MSDRTFAMDEDVVTLIEEARRFDTAPAGYASRLQGAHDLIDRLAAALAARPLPETEEAATLEQLDALAVGSVIVDARNWVFAKFRVAESDTDDDFDAEGVGRPAWWLTGHEGEFPAAGILLPARILDRGGEGA